MLKKELPCEKEVRRVKDLHKMLKSVDAAEKGDFSKITMPSFCPTPSKPEVIKRGQHVPLIQQKDRKQPPVLLTRQRFAKIYSHATNAKEAKAAQERDKDELYKQYLKDGSDELVQKFGGNFKRTQSQKLEEKRLALEQKNKDIEASFKNLTEQYTKERFEKIKRAQKLLESMKPGPRELRSAALQSEIYNARNQQLAIREHYNKAIAKQEELDKSKCLAQRNDSLAEDLERANESIKRRDDYKKEIKQTIDENLRVSIGRRRQELKEAIAEREAFDRNVKSEIEKEKAAMRRKMEMNRKNALEAMLMVEQRRLRESMTDNIEDRVNCVFNAGQHQIKKMLKEHTQHVREEKERIHDKTIEIITSMQKEDPRFQEEARLKRDISYQRLKFTVEEEKKKEKIRLAKKARIEEYLREVQQQKKNQAIAEEKHRFEMAERFKNTEVNRIFQKQEEEKKMKKITEIKSAYAAQILENTIIHKRRLGDRTRDCIAELRFIKDDNRFYEYAAELMEHARSKGRSLQPFIYVVQQYRRDNKPIGEVTPETIRKDLAANISIKREPAPKVDVKEPQVADICGKERNEVQDNIKANIARIEKLIAEEAAEKTKPCPTYCPIECSRHKSLNMEPTPSERMRYSVWELKQLNQYDAVGECVNQPQPVLIK